MDAKSVELTLAARRLQKQRASLESLDAILASAVLDPVSRSFFFNKRARVENAVKQTEAVLSALGSNSSQVDAFAEGEPKKRKR